jgi:type II secretory pathway pseudopilin PulG
MSISRDSRQAGITLIELIISMAVMLVITTMVLLGWFAMQSSYSYSTSSNVQRDDARQAMSRTQREIRDAEARPLPNTDPAIVRARPFWIEFSTTFNQAGNTDVGVTPRLVMYRLYSDKSIWRFMDTGGNGAISGVNLSPGTDDPSGWSTHEQVVGEGARLVLRNVVNYSRDPSDPTPLFLYTYYDNDGNLVTADHAYNWTVGGVGHNDRTSTTSVTVQVLDDLVPGHAPAAAELTMTAQLRNQR